MSNPNFSAFQQILTSLFAMVCDENGRVSPSRLLTAMVLAVFISAFMNIEKIADYIKDIQATKTHEAYLAVQENYRKARFETAVKNQSQILYANLKPDMVGVWIYKPENLHHFQELISYEGSLPDGVELERLTNMPVDRTSMEYLDHIRGTPYESYGPISPVTKITKTDYYVYSCPVFDSRGSYYGVVGMYWRDRPVDVDYNKYMSQCAQAARFIGIEK